jgi:hypothetical protein
MAKKSILSRLSSEDKKKFTKMYDEADYFVAGTGLNKGSLRFEQHDQVPKDSFSKEVSIWWLYTGSLYIPEPEEELEKELEKELE